MTNEQRLKLTPEELAAAHALISKIGLEELAYVYGIGAKKYAPNLWLEQPIPIEKLYGRILGHMRKRIEGEIYDKDDKQMHMASVAWSALTIVHYDRGA